MSGPARARLAAGIDPAPPPRSSGSALLLSLVLLLVVSLLCLSLSLLTTAERVLGAHRRGIEQALWAAESGLGLAAARLLAANDLSSLEVDLGPGIGATGSGRGLLRNRARMSPVRPLLLAPCDLCQVNGAGSYAAGDGLSRIHLALVSEGLRIYLPDGSIPVRKRLEATLDLEPWSLPGSELIPAGEE